MKQSLFFILFALPILIFGQDFKLPEPNLDRLKAEIKKSDYTEDVIYLYLNQDFDSISKKKQIVHYDYPDFSICSFNQDFEYGINYSIEQCREAGGSTISLVLPKSNRKSLVKWIEMIFQSSSMDIEHNWNPNKTQFRPVDRGAGCYFEIKETGKNTIVNNYCGC